MGGPEGPERRMYRNLKRQENHCFCFRSALRQCRRGNSALITTLPVLDCLNLVQHLLPMCLEDRFLPWQTRKGTAEAQSLQHIISHLPAVLTQPGVQHLLAQEIHRKMTAQSCPRKLLSCDTTEEEGAGDRPKCKACTNQGLYGYQNGSQHPRVFPCSCARQRWRGWRRRTQKRMRTTRRMVGQARIWRTPRGEPTTFCVSGRNTVAHVGCSRLCFRHTSSSLLHPRFPLDCHVECENVWLIWAVHTLHAQVIRLCFSSCSSKKSFM